MTMCGSMADIQSVMAEIRQGKTRQKKKEKKKPEGKNIMTKCPSVANTACLPKTSGITISNHQIMHLCH